MQRIAEFPDFAIQTKFAFVYINNLCGLSPLFAF